MSQPTIKDLFMLDPSVTFLNHGSFGATPKPVFQIYQEWQTRLENQPVLFLWRGLQGYLEHARQVLASHLSSEPENLVYIPNATYGVNIIARSLFLQPGDEILTTNHEYGACNNTWEFLCKKTGARYIQQPIPLPIQSQEEKIERFWAGVSSRTKVIYLSHITSPTALCLPVEAICKRARQAGILTLIDGAHAPGQIPLDLEAIGADFYVGNCHKWMLSPKGAGFLYARPEAQELLEPLVVSWGYSATPQTTAGSQFLDYLQWTGTHDPAAMLSVPAAIDFMQQNNWEAVRQSCHDLLKTAIERLCELSAGQPPYPLGSDFYYQMAIAPLPPGTDVLTLKARLYDEYKVEVPLIEWNEHKFIRVSIQAYNTEEDIDVLLSALQKIIVQINH